MDDRILKMLEQTLDSKSLAKVREAIEDAARLTVIRDAFLNGRDVEAVTLIKQLDLTKAKRKINKNAAPVLGMRRAILGISSSAEISPGQNVTCVTRPQIPFKPDRFAVSRRCSSAFLIERFQVGNRAQDVANSTIPADMMEASFPELPYLFDSSEPGMPIEIRIDSFVEAQFGIPIDMDTCQVAQDLVVQVSNDGPIPLRFYGLYLGVCPNSGYSGGY